MKLRLACADFAFPLLPHDKVLDLIALLDLSHLGAPPNALHDHQAVDGRLNRELVDIVRVAFFVTQVALLGDLQNRSLGVVGYLLARQIGQLLFEGSLLLFHGQLQELDVNDRADFRCP